MAVLVPLICALLILAWALLSGAGFRKAFLIMCVVIGVLVAGITELLSLFHAVTYGGLPGAWTCAAALSAWAVARRWASMPKWWGRQECPLHQRLLAGVWFLSRRMRKSVCAAWRPLWGVGAIVVMTGIIAVASAPSNWDSMTYHLPRVMRWMQDRSVAHFPSNFHPQLYHPPWAEFAILHLQILAGSDRFAFAVQWGSMIGSVIGASLIARHIGAGALGQSMAAVFVATLPAGILQSESTQNSYVVALWLVCFVESVFAFSGRFGHALWHGRPAREPGVPGGRRSIAGRLRDGKPKGWMGPAAFAGASLGLALLTKGTAYLFAIPFVLWLCFIVLKGAAPWRGRGRSPRPPPGAHSMSARHDLPPRTDVPRRLAALLALAGVALALNCGHYIRNIRTFGSPLLPRNEAVFYRVDSMSLPLLASNLARHIAIQIWYPGNRIAGKAQAVWYAIYRALNMDPSDPRITVPHRTFQLSPILINEDITGNPFHELLIAVVLLLCVRRIVRKPCKTDLANRKELNGAGLLLGLITAALIAFCAGVKWMEFNGRLELPLFVLTGAPVGAVLSRAMRPRYLSAIAWALLAMCIPFLLENPSHPLLGPYSILRTPREAQYFLNHRSMQGPYEQAADLIASRRAAGPIGIDAPGLWEYPFWVLSLSLIHISEPTR